MISSVYNFSLFLFATTYRNLITDKEAATEKEKAGKISFEELFIFALLRAVDSLG